MKSFYPICPSDQAIKEIYSNPLKVFLPLLLSFFSRENEAVDMVLENGNICSLILMRVCTLLQ